MIVVMDHTPTAKDVGVIIKAMATESERIQYLEGQYLGEQDILGDPSPGADKPDNRLVANFPGYITTVHTGYFMGHPVSYESENDEFMAVLRDINADNNEAEHNFELAKTASKTGRAYELLYVDENSNIKFSWCDPSDVIMIVDHHVDAKIIGALRFWTIETASQDTVTYCELYDRDTVYLFKGGAAASAMTLQEERPHFFGDVPIVEYKNNKEGQGDYEKVLSLVHSYDKTQSENANDFEYFSDAYLKITGASGTNGDDVTTLKHDKVLILPDGADAEWMIKAIQDTANENYKNRLEADIHKMSFTPDLSDESFAGNTSGEAMKYKLWGLEQMAVQKERGFQKGLQRRIKLICNVLATKGKVYDFRDVRITFTRNMPSIVSDVAETIGKLAGLVPHKRLLALLPFVEDAEQAYQELQDEKAGMINLDDYEGDDGRTEED